MKYERAVKDPVWLHAGLSVGNPVLLITLSITTIPRTSQEQQKEVRVSLEIYFCFLTSSQQLQGSTSHNPLVSVYTIRPIDYLLISLSGKNTTVILYDNH